MMMQPFLSVLLLNFTGALRLSTLDPDSTEWARTGYQSYMKKALSQSNFDIGEKSGLRPALETKIQESSPWPVLYFIGDSLQRQQATVACAVVQKNNKIDKALAKFRMEDHHCKGELGEVVFAWTPHLSPSKVADLQKAKFGTPTAVFWGSAFWSDSSAQEYTQMANQTMHAYAEDAPNADLKVFLAHKPCPDMKFRDDKLHSVDYIKKINDIQVMLAKNEGTPTRIVDGYKFTEELGCAASEDGRHWDKYVFQELMMMLET